jgi:membrane-associated phospholipid phosphatase
VAMGVHYLSDILAGMLLGLLMGFIVLAFIPALL